MAIRRSTGNTLVLTIAITACMLTGVGLVALQLVQMYGSKHEHINATEAAALAAAQALSRIVIEDRNIGFISASDYPPVGSDTVAGDGYSMPVWGINTLAATVRLDMIVADLLDDNVMRRLALNDYYDYHYAASLLRDELYRCSKEDKFGRDLNGNSVCIYNEARDAYLASYSKMTGKPPSLDGFKVTLGFVEGLTTNVPIPKPSQFAFMNSDDQEAGFYKSCRNIPYKNRNFTFAPASVNLTLIDPQLFELRSPALVGGVVPTVAKVETTQQVQSVDFQAQQKVDNIESQACAYGGIMHENLNRPGALFLTFDGGNYAGLTTLKQVLNTSEFCLEPTDTVELPPAGDSPPKNLANATIPPFIDNHPPFGQVMRVAIYDWIRRYRDQPNVQSLLDVFDDSFVADTNPGGSYYTMLANGTLIQRTFAVGGVNRLAIMPVAHRQYRAVSGIALDTDTYDFDLIVKDFVNRRGRIEGGDHGGEPYPWTGGTVKVIAQPREIDDEVTMVYTYPPLTGDTKRPGWSNSLAVCSEIRVRKR